MAALITITTDDGVLDLPKNFHQQFYVTRQIFNLNNFETRNADFTKTITVPATPTNTSLLKSISDLTGTTGESSNKVRCSISINGIMIAPVAWLLHFRSKIDRNSSEYELTIFYGNFNLFDDLSGQTIDKLNWADTAVEWEVADILAASKYTYLDNKLVWGFGDWNTRGSRNLGYYVAELSSVININATGFFLYARNIIERMLSEAGYTLVVEDVPTEFNTIALACPVTKYIEIEDVDGLSLSSQVQNAALQAIQGGTVRGIFPTEVTDVAGLWSTVNNEYTITSTQSYTLEVKGTVTHDRGNPNNAASRVVVFQNAVEIASFSVSLDRTDLDFFISIQVSGVAGDIFYVNLESDVSNTPYSILTLNTQATFNIYTTGVDASRTVQPSDHIPQMVQSTFLANILKLYNLFMVTDDVRKTVTLNSFDTIFSNEEIDLSEKLAGGINPVEIDHYLPSLGQQSSLKWIEDNLLRRDANTTLVFDNQILEKEIDVVTMDFSACDNSIQYYTQGTDVTLKAKIPMSELTEEYTGKDLLHRITVQSGGGFSIREVNSGALQSFSVGDYMVILTSGLVFEGIHRVIDKNSDSTGKLSGPFSIEILGIEQNLGQVFSFKAEDFEPRLAILHEDVAGVAPNYSVMQGSDLGKALLQIGSLTASWKDSLLMSSVADTHYKSIFNSLQTPQVITTKFNLSAIEVTNWDFTRPVYISQFNAFYYVNRIEQFKVDNLTQLELVRISKAIKSEESIPPPPPSDFTATLLLGDLGSSTLNNSVSTITTGGATMGFNADTVLTGTGFYDFPLQGETASIEFRNISGTLIIKQALSEDVTGTLVLTPNGNVSWEGGDITFKLIAETI